MVYFRGSPFPISILRIVRIVSLILALAWDFWLCRQLLPATAIISLSTDISMFRSAILVTNAKHLHTIAFAFSHRIISTKRKDKITNNQNFIQTLFGGHPGNLPSLIFILLKLFLRIYLNAVRWKDDSCRERRAKNKNVVKGFAKRVLLLMMSLRLV